MNSPKPGEQIMTTPERETTKVKTYFADNGEELEPVVVGHYVFIPCVRVRRIDQPDMQHGIGLMPTVQSAAKAVLAFAKKRLTALMDDGASDQACALWFKQFIYDDDEEADRAIADVRTAIKARKKRSKKSNG